MALKPFDLEAAKRGEPLVTRDGEAAYLIAHVPEFAEWHRIIVRISGKAHPVSAYENGSFCADSFYGHDLFMAPRKVTRWVNLHPNGNAYHYATEEESRAMSHPENVAIAIPIEIEE